MSFSGDVANARASTMIRPVQVAWAKKFRSAFQHNSLSGSTSDSSCFGDQIEDFQCARVGAGHDRLWDKSGALCNFKTLQSLFA